MKQGEKIGAADVQHFIPFGQDCVEIGILDMANPCGRSRNRHGAVRVGMTAQPVKAENSYRASGYSNRKVQELPRVSPGSWRSAQRLLPEWSGRRR